MEEQNFGEPIRFCTRKFSINALMAVPLMGSMKYVEKRGRSRKKNPFWVERDAKIQSDG